MLSTMSCSSASDISSFYASIQELIIKNNYTTAENLLTVQSKTDPMAFIWLHFLYVDNYCESENGKKVEKCKEEIAAHISFYKGLINKKDVYNSFLTCFALGYIYRYGLGVSPNPDLSKQYYVCSEAEGKNIFSLTQLSLYYYNLGQYKEMLDILNQEGYPPPHPFVFYICKSHAYRRLDRQQERFEMHKACLEDKNLGELGKIEHAMRCALALRALKRYGEAIEYLGKALKEKNSPSNTLILLLKDTIMCMEKEKICLSQKEEKESVLKEKVSPVIKKQQEEKGVGSNSFFLKNLREHISSKLPTFDKDSTHNSDYQRLV